MMTGLPIRASIGGMTRAMAAESLGLDPASPTLAVLGGSQGSRAINRVVRQMLEGLSPQEQRRWQWIHLTGSEDETGLREAYQALGVRAWVRPFSDDMTALYAQSDLVIARAGASTIAELARCGIPAILIPYPFAEGHQRLNAKLVEDAGGGLVVEESEASPERVLGLIRCVVADRRLRSIMGAQMRTLHRHDATQRLCDAILDLADDNGR
jgi:UDP-N-acetylglucosamine--N-acetylmuramyl-(pentapeptide) pyrophosphoryl-undecaprenol N-acetylglucosamine transferase